MEGKLVQSCDGMELREMKSTNENGMVGTGCIATLQSGKQMVIGYYGGTLIHSSLYCNTNVEKKRGEVLR